MALFLMVIQALTGILLSLHYEPSARPAVNAHGESLLWQENKLVETSSASHSQRPSPAFLSVMHTLTIVPFGRIIRGVHHWSAHVLIATALLWFSLALVAKSYRRILPTLWWCGLGGMMLLLAAGWTGHVLPWNVRSFVAAEIVFASLPQAFPIVGTAVVAVLRGAPTIAPETLPRLYAIHILVLPVFALSSLVLMRVWRTLTPHIAAMVRRHPHEYALAGIAVVFLLTAASVLLSIAPTAAERLPADLASTTPAPSGIKPEWYFLAPYALSALLSASLAASTAFAVPLPSWCLGLAALLVVAHLAALPFVDGAANSTTNNTTNSTTTSRAQSRLRERFYTAANLGIIIGYLALTLIGGVLL
jgi:quinol-cytochrome oxidoreductase complex cytochrome b subunit